MGPSRTLTVEQAAKTAGCNPETIRRAIRRKDLLAKRHPTAPGRPFLIEAADLKAYLDKRSLA